MNNKMQFFNYRRIVNIPQLLLILKSQVLILSFFINMGYGEVNQMGPSPSAGLYMDTTYYNQYPPGMKLTDGVPDEIREVVDAHWDNFAPVNPLIPHFFGILFFFLWIISFLGNGCVIYIFAKTKSLRTPVS